MLNAMMMRDIEEPLFEATKRWLAEDERNVFSLVVDELHLYRGTQGSEVAMIVRNLLSRFGIEPDLQLRCGDIRLALDDNSGLDFLEQFFGVDRKLFRDRSRLVSWRQTSDLATADTTCGTLNRLTPEPEPSRWSTSYNFLLPLQLHAAELARPTAPRPEMRPGVCGQPESQTSPKTSLTSRIPTAQRCRRLCRR